MVMFFAEILFTFWTIEIKIVLKITVRVITIMLLIVITNAFLCYYLPLYYLIIINLFVIIIIKLYSHISNYNKVFLFILHNYDKKEL